MLAERRQKQKWTLNPRGKFWSEDQNKFGQRMLEKMGWSSGKGLGANEDGITEHISQAYKNDTKGVGFKDRDDQWTAHEDKFTSLLASLGQDSTEIEKPKTSLVVKSKTSRARVHYHKFTKGKDLSSRSEKDLANIFGRTALEKKKPVEEVVEVDIKEEEKDFGVKTLQAGSMADYFKAKLEKIGQTLSPRKRAVSDSEGEGTTFGFGFNGFKDTDNDKEVHAELPEEPVKKKKKKRALDIDDQEDKKPKKKMKSKVEENVTDCYDNPGFDLNVPERCKPTEKDFEVNTKKKKKTKIEGIDNPVVLVPEETEPKKKKKKKKMRLEGIDNPTVEDTITEAYDNPAFNPNVVLETIAEENEEDTSKTTQDDSVSNNTKTVKKKKKNKKETAIFYDNEQVEESASLQVKEEERKGKKRKKTEETGIDNPALEDNWDDGEHYSKEKKRKKEKEIGLDNLGFDIKNAEEIQNSGDVDPENLKIKKKKKGSETVNLGLNYTNSEEIPNGDDINRENLKIKKKKKAKENINDVAGIGSSSYENKGLDIGKEKEEETEKNSKVKNKKKKKTPGIENPACTANSAEQRVEETITSMNAAIDNYQNELENDINEKKDTELNFTTKKQFVLAVQSKSVSINFPGIDIYKIKGYGTEYSPAAQ